METWIQVLASTFIIIRPSIRFFAGICFPLLVILSLSLRRDGLFPHYCCPCRCNFFILVFGSSCSDTSFSSFNNVLYSSKRIVTYHKSQFQKLSSSTFEASRHFPVGPSKQCHLLLSVRQFRCNASRSQRYHEVSFNFAGGH